MNTTLDAAINLHRSGKPQSAMELYRVVLAQEVEVFERYQALIALATALLDLGQAVEAEPVCRQAIRFFPDLHPAYLLLAMILKDTGHIDAAGETVSQALARAPDDIVTLNYATGIDLARGQVRDALSMAEHCLRLLPGNRRALAHQAVAWAALGRNSELDHLLDFDRLLRQTVVSSPAEFDSIDAFNRGLAEAIHRSLALDPQPFGKTLINGLRLHDTFVIGGALADALRHMFTEAVRNYGVTLAVDDAHPARIGIPRNIQLKSWSNVMAEHSYEAPHIHDGHWISGTYYVEMPTPTTASDNTENPGAIEFGGHDFGANLPELGPCRRILPVPGLLILFPSYFYHRTFPVSGHGRRISIAFDVEMAKTA